MSRAVHGGPTDSGQARGEPLRGDPEGGAGIVPEQILKLALDGWHRSKGARMSLRRLQMPVQYQGIIAEHLWTRENAGLFDVSHMGQLLVHGRDVDAALETLLPGELKLLGDMKLRYSLLLLDDSGGIIDDLMATRRGTDFYVVVNGATKHDDIAVLKADAARGRGRSHEGGGAYRLQGPRRSRCSSRSRRGRRPELHEGGRFASPVTRRVYRSGYTGEDGFEISIRETRRQRSPTRWWGDRVKPVGLGARIRWARAGLPL